MNLLIGLIAIVAVVYFLRVLVALRRERRPVGPRNIMVYVVEPDRPGIYKVPARSYGRFAVIDGGQALANPVVAVSTVSTPSNVLPYRPRIHTGAANG